MINLAIINTSNVISDRQVAAWLDPLQRYVSEHVTPIWGTEAVLHFYPTTMKADPSMWWVVIANRTGVSGALGYHDVHPGGLPYARIGARDDKQYGYSIPVTVAHEIAEMLGDPNVDQVVPMPFAGRTVYVAKELSDAVEADALGLTVGGLLCSNFVLPSYFVPGSAGPWDAQGALAGPFPHLTAGGYMGFQTSDGLWHQITARRRDGLIGHRALRNLGRSARRAGAPSSYTPGHPAHKPK